MWDGQLPPALTSIRLKAFGGRKFEQGTTKLHARILWGKGAQKKMKPNMFTVRSSTSATFVLPVRHGTGVALQTKSTEVSQNPQSNRVANESQEIRICYVEYDDQAEARAASRSRLVISH